MKRYVNKHWMNRVQHHKLKHPSLLLTLSLLIVNIAFAHGGRTNSSGCHNVKRTGGYHCHNAGNTPRYRLKNSEFKAIAKPPVGSEKKNFEKIVLQTQKYLNILGYEDGIFGERTVQALKSYQRTQRMVADGRISQALILRLKRSVVQENRIPNALPSNKTCDHHSYRAKDNCHTTQTPKNAVLEASGATWRCRHGYYKTVDNKCWLVQMPENAILNANGNDWNCRYGYYKTDNNKCWRVLIRDDTVPMKN